MRGIIVYRSKYGAAKEYAQMLAAKTGFSLCALAGIKAAELAAYDRVVLCSGVYVGKIAGLKFLKRHADALRKKRTAIFAVGLSPADESTLETLKKNDRSGTLAQFPLFYGQGAWKGADLKAGDKLLCGMLHGMLAKKDPSQYEEPWMRTFMECYGRSCDFTDEAYLAPLLAWLERP